LEGLEKLGKTFQAPKSLSLLSIYLYKYIYKNKELGSLEGVGDVLAG
jgi:hypothetical protein